MTTKLKRGLAVCTVLCMILCIGVCALAADGDGPVPSPDLVDKDGNLLTGTITIFMEYKKTAVPGDGKADFSLYKVADWVPTEDGRYTFEMLPEFSECGVELSDDITKTGTASDAWRLGLWATTKMIKPDATLIVDKKGQVSFKKQEYGLYLVMQNYAVSPYKVISPFLISLPTYDAEKGTFVDNIWAKPKVEVKRTVNPQIELMDNPPDNPPPDNPPPDNPPPDNPPDNPDNPPDNPPESDLPPDDVPLSDWPAGDEPPEGTPPEVELDEPPVPLAEMPGLPQTGQLWWPVILMAAVGAVFVCSGFAMKRRDKYEK